jgi:hypothetical protein
MQVGGRGERARGEEAVREAGRDPRLQQEEPTEAAGSV